jgi:hypothetical protein
MLLTTAEYVKTLGMFVRVWRNEFTRVICDRLISVEVGSVLLLYGVLWLVQEEREGCGSRAMETMR